MVFYTIGLSPLNVFFKGPTISLGLQIWARRPPFKGRPHLEKNVFFRALFELSPPPPPNLGNLYHFFLNAKNVDLSGIQRLKLKIMQKVTKK